MLASRIRADILGVHDYSGVWKRWGFDSANEYVFAKAYQLISVSLDARLVLVGAE